MNALDRVLIRQACIDLTSRYALAVNTSDTQAFIALFTDDAIWQRPGVPPLEGIDAIRTFIAGEFEKTRVIRHVNGAVLVDINGEQGASGWSQTTVYHAPGENKIPVRDTRPEMVVEYRDQFRCVDRQWRFARRDTRIVFTRT
jgi:uncharacterized protein (TIGR02246 family)